MVVESMYIHLPSDIPQLHALIVRARDNQSLIRRELGSSYPISMTSKGQYKLHSLYVP